MKIEKEPSFMPIKTAVSVVQWGVLALLALMPLHAFLSVWLGSLTGQQSIIQAWKEVIIILLLIPGTAILWYKRSLLRQPLIIAISAFAALSLLISLIFQPQIASFTMGVKTDLFFLIVFILAWLSGERVFQQRALKVLLTSSGVVIAFGLLQLIALPNDFLANFGYGPETVVPYLLVAGAEDSVRILSTLGGPNQLGAFLILPLCLVLAMFIRQPKWWHVLYLIGGLAVEWNTFSRSAWIGLAAAAFITVAMTVPPRFRARTAGGLLTLGLTIAIILGLNFNHPTVQHYILHGSTANLVDSTDLHASANQAGVAYIVQNPIGRGLGSAGPASFYGDKPFIPESYYLQLAAEVGIIGLFIFIIICALLGRKLWLYKKIQSSAIPVFASLIGISAVNLFLHGWADSSTALTYWAYAGIVVGSKA